MRAQINNKDYEQLSAYLDGQLAPGERNKLEERMRAHPELKVALEQLTSTRAMIRMAPRRRAPRNFTLTPEMVGDFQPGRRRKWFSNLFPVLSFASAVATLVLVATLIFDLSPGLRPASTAEGQPPAVAMEPVPVEGEAEIREVPAAEATPALESQMAAPEQAAPKASGTEQGEQPAAEVAEAPVEVPAAGEDAGALPPAITWNDPNAPGVPPGMGGGVYADPPVAWGRGGGAGDGPVSIYPDSMPSLVLPLEAAETISGAAEAEEQAAPQAPAAAPSVTGGGPILGLPSAEEAGEIEVNSAFGLPLEYPETDEAAPAGQDAFRPTDRPASQGPEAGGPVQQPTSLRILQAVLALVAIASGAAAFIIRRNRA